VLRAKVDCVVSLDSAPDKVSQPPPDDEPSEPAPPAKSKKK
jgi:hypothetical protein